VGQKMLGKHCFVKAVVDSKSTKKETLKAKRLNSKVEMIKIKTIKDFQLKTKFYKILGHG